MALQAIAELKQLQDDIVADGAEKAAELNELNEVNQELSERLDRALAQSHRIQSEPLALQERTNQPLRGGVRPAVARR